MQQHQVDTQHQAYGHANQNQRKQKRKPIFKPMNQPDIQAANQSNQSSHRDRVHILDAKLPYPEYTSLHHLLNK